MAQVSVTINGRAYQIACDDGQEEHLRQLAGYIDRRMAELIAAMGQIGDMRLLVMVSLLIADELSEVTRQLDDTRKTSEDARSTATKVDAQAASALESIAARIEDIAARLEHA
ncbi:MAG: cell division protein ZapA [Alphaproteobacteria bacterium]|nr:cell division protein ZapA [Alphaproteobacteria bacterium]